MERACEARGMGAGIGKGIAARIKVRVGGTGWGMTVRRKVAGWRKEE